MRRRRDPKVILISYKKIKKRPSKILYKESVYVTEEWETRKKKEITTTRQIETRVKRQVVLEDGEVVEDTGPIVTTNTTEDVEQQEHTTQEVRMCTTIYIFLSFFFTVCIFSWFIMLFRKIFVVPYFFFLFFCADVECLWTRSVLITQSITRYFTLVYERGFTNIFCA